MGSGARRTHVQVPPVLLARWVVHPGCDHPLLFSLGGNTNICIAPGCREDVCFGCLPNGSDCPFSFSKLSHPTPHLQGLGCLPSPSLPPSGESWMATSQQKEGHLLIKIKNDHTGEQLVESGNRPSAQQEGRRLSVSGC